MGENILFWLLSSPGIALMTAGVEIVAEFASAAGLLYAVADTTLTIILWLEFSSTFYSNRRYLVSPFLVQPHSNTDETT